MILYNSFCPQVVVLLILNLDERRGGGGAVNYVMIFFFGIDLFLLYRYTIGKRECYENDFAFGAAK